MTNEDKQLLLKDLCARLPYGVKVQNIINTKVYNWREYLYCLPAALVTNFRPYLRPMSSMTEKEIEEYNSFSLGEDWLSNPFAVVPAFSVLDWLKAHHFDYRGLIEMGLALEAPEEMYNV